MTKKPTQSGPAMPGRKGINTKIRQPQNLTPRPPSLAPGNSPPRIGQGTLIKMRIEQLRAAGALDGPNPRKASAEAPRQNQPITPGAGGGVEFVEDHPRTPSPSVAISTNSTEGQVLGRTVVPADSLLEDYLAFARTQVESADSYIVGAFLPVVAACLARNVYFPWGDERIYPNLFAMLAGRSGDRKSTAINLAESLAKQLFPPSRFLAHTCSAESLFNEYDQNCDGAPDKLLIADDANPLLGTWTRSGYGERVGQRFLNLYDCKALTEAFERNKKTDAQGRSRRIVLETSTNVVLGATFDVCRLQGRGISSGLQRRFLFFAATRHGRLIACPPVTNKETAAHLVGMLTKLIRLKAECRFAQNATDLWATYQQQNRRLLQDQSDEAQAARLNGAPRHVQKVAMLFEATVWAKQSDSSWGGIIQHSTLQLAIEHVNHCLQTAARLDELAAKSSITTSADVLLARIRRDFRAPEFVREDLIVLTKTHLTAKYAPHPDRPHAWKPDDLYFRFIPNLIERGMARLASQQGKKVCYGFALED